jgi:hypothetical protein
VKPRYNIQYHFLALLAAVVVVGMRFGDIRGYFAWQKGTATTEGEIDDISATNRVRVIRYAYQVDGKGYTDEIYSKTGFSEGAKATVTYAVSDPQVSTLQPEKMASIFRNSLLISLAATLPMLIMWFGELMHAVRKRRESVSPSST